MTTDRKSSDTDHDVAGQGMSRRSLVTAGTTAVSAMTHGSSIHFRRGEIDEANRARAVLAERGTARHHAFDGGRNRRRSGADDQWA